MKLFRTFSFLFATLLFISCGGETKTNQPKDLSFSTAETPAAYSDIVMLAISSYRGNVLLKELGTDKDIDLAILKKTSNTYAEAMRKGDWVRDDLEIKQDGNKFKKSYRWLDKRRRMAMTVDVNTIKRGSEISLESIDFDTNLDILEKISF